MTAWLVAGRARWKPPAVSWPAKEPEPGVLMRLSEKQRLLWPQVKEELLGLTLEELEARRLGEWSELRGAYTECVSGSCGWGGGEVFDPAGLTVREIQARLVKAKADRVTDTLHRAVGAEVRRRAN